MAAPADLESLPGPARPYASPPISARHLVLVSASAEPCGVEAFARRLASAAGPAACTKLLASGWSIREGGRSAGNLVVNLPVVAWKGKLLGPAIAAAAARAAGGSVTLILHEWADLNPARRASYVALLPFATALLFSAPEVRAQFERSRLSALATRRRAIVPIPPNLTRPPVLGTHPLIARLQAEQESGRVILGHFGSIYPKKQSTIVLDVAAALRDRGQDPLVVFIGSFVRGHDEVEKAFWSRVSELSLDSQVVVTGYVRSEAEVFALFECVDVFLYAFADGLTSRRGSVLACALSGRPVVVNAARDPDAFAHHPTYRSLLERGHIRLAATEAGVEELATLTAEVASAATRHAPIDTDAAWRDAAAILDWAAPERQPD